MYCFDWEKGAFVKREGVAIVGTVCGCITMLRCLAAARLHPRHTLRIIELLDFHSWLLMISMPLT